MSSSDAGTPAVSDAANTTSPIKKDDATTETKPLFTAKEENLLKIAMVHCLKSGPPEIDYVKFQKYGDFNTLKTAQNTWGKMKKKLIDAAGPMGEDEDGAEAAATPKPKATPKKRTPAKKAAGEADDEEASPKKNAKKASPQKAAKMVKAGDEEEKDIKAEQTEE